MEEVRFDFTIETVALIAKLSSRQIIRYIHLGRPLYGVTLEVRRTTNARGAGYMVSNASVEKLKRVLARQND